MFSLNLGNHHELRLLQISDADKLFGLVDKNRLYLRTWLPWLDGTTVFSDTQDFIKFTLQQLADNRGFVTAICLEKSIAGVGRATMARTDSF
ncbi:MAG: hypothetical protein RLZZ69_3049 [Cyanobacteriota bacterium]|jgi:ribosomal-protein-serine acetyltransferase